MATATATSLDRLEEILGEDAKSLLEHQCKTVSKDALHLPGPDFVTRAWGGSDRPIQALRSLESIYNHGRLGGSGYVSILPVDQGIEHSAGASFAKTPIYFGSEQSSRQIVEVSRWFHEAHQMGMATVLWCYVRNPAFTVDGKNYEVSADLTGQANHIGVTIEADIIKQKAPELNGGFNAIKFGKTSPLVYEKLTTDHPIDLTRYQVLNCYAGRVGLINSGGASSGETDLKEAVRTAVINKRAGGTGLISGRKAFQRPFEEGIGLLNAVQDVYLNAGVSIA